MSLQGLPQRKVTFADIRGTSCEEGVPEDNSNCLTKNDSEGQFYELNTDDVFNGDVLTSEISVKKGLRNTEKSWQKRHRLSSSTSFTSGSAGHSSNHANRTESGIQRLEYELSNLKSRLFDSIQEYEDLKDCFPDKKFPSTWEPPSIKNLRQKVARLSERIDKEKNKQRLKVKDVEVKRIVEKLLDHCVEDDSMEGDVDPFESFNVEETIRANNEMQKLAAVSRKNALRAADGTASSVKIPEQLKSRQRKLFIAGNHPPRSSSDREASQASLDCALSRLPTLSRRYRGRKFPKRSRQEKIVLIPNQRRVTNGRAFVHERQKEFTKSHEKTLYEMDVTFTRTAFEQLMKEKLVKTS